LTDATFLFGINSLTHDHMGYVVLSQNPHQPRADREGQEIRYGDPRLFAKYALRDFLRDRYRATKEDLPQLGHRAEVPLYRYARDASGPERAALERLNAAWGTRYSTWDTSSGDLVRGDNAWGVGTGLMDENGWGVIAPDARSVGFDRQFTNPAHPAIRKDLDDFLAVFAARYGSVLAEAFAQVPHPVLLLPVYNGPDFVYKALAPFVDGFWVSVPEAKDALRIYHAGRKPLVVADYLSADPDSPLYFKAKIRSVRFDPTSGNTAIAAPLLRYVFRMPQTIAFPDCPGLEENYRRLGRPYPYPRVKSASDLWAVRDGQPPSAAKAHYVRCVVGLFLLRPIHLRWIRRLRGARRCPQGRGWHGEATRCPKPNAAGLKSDCRRLSRAGRSGRRIGQAPSIKRTSCSTPCCLSSWCWWG